MQTPTIIKTPEQESILDTLRLAIESGEFRSGLSVGIIQNICHAFGGDVLSSFLGAGGTRIVISHPSLDGYVLKIAFNENGIQGNKDEYDDYHAAPDEIKEFLAEPGELFDDNIVLEMRYYDAFTEQEQLDNYAEQLKHILSKIKLVNYEDPPYHHSFGTDENGTLVMLDYGETEKFHIL